MSKNNSSTVIFPASDYHNHVTRPQIVVDSDKFIDLYNAVAEVINFCYEDGKGWIGTETIRRSSKFLDLMDKLCTAIDPFIPVGTQEEDEVE